MFARLGYAHLDAVLGVRKEVMGHDVRGSVLIVMVPCLVSFRHRAIIGWELCPWLRDQLHHFGFRIVRPAWAAERTLCLLMFSTPNFVE